MALAARSGAEEAFEEQPGIDLGRHRGGGRTPGQVVLIDAGIARVAGAEVLDDVAGEFQRSEGREQADLLRHDLIGGDSGVEIVAAGLLDPHAREERAVGPGRGRRRHRGRRRPRDRSSRRAPGPCP